MKAQFVVTMNDDRTVSIDKVNTPPLNTNGLTSFVVVNSVNGAAACVTLADQLVKIA
jgi:hypothetical protein